jgi:hypothetical protein
VQRSNGVYFFFFEEPTTRVRRGPVRFTEILLRLICCERKTLLRSLNITAEVVLQNRKSYNIYKKDNNNNLTKEATTNPLPPEKQSPRSSKATAMERHSARHKAHAT